MTDKKERIATARELDEIPSMLYLRERGFLASINDDLARQTELGDVFFKLGHEFALCHIEIQVTRQYTNFTWAKKKNEGYVGTGKPDCTLFMLGALIQEGDQEKMNFFMGYADQLVQFVTTPDNCIDKGEYYVIRPDQLLLNYRGSLYQGATHRDVLRAFVDAEMLSA